MSYLHINDTIVALASGVTNAAISIIRLSGNKCFEIAEKLTQKSWENIKGNTLSYCQIIDESSESNNEKDFIDDVVISTYRKPHSYTKEDCIEISVHSSPFIIEKIVTLCISHGARQAFPGEFTQRAYLNGQLDLTQAEAVADLIASESKTSHRVAMQQLKGIVSNEIKTIREQLLEFASLLELELDFGEEDVEFADRNKLKALAKAIITHIQELVDSFAMGNAFKNGIPVAIVGKPNAGKSTLLNILLKEEKAIVSPIPGTTRDAIEDVIIIEGFKIRLIDTAGMRNTEDEIEQLGIQKTLSVIEKAEIIIHLIDAAILTNAKGVDKELQQYSDEQLSKVILTISKSDTRANGDLETLLAIGGKRGYSIISAKNGIGIDALKSTIIERAGMSNVSSNRVLVSNIRHKQELDLVLKHIEVVFIGIEDGVTHDWLATDLRHAIHHLGNIIGEISTDDILGNIFGKFCIGK